MSEIQELFVGIDVSKAALDVHVHPTAQAWRFDNDETGRAALVAALVPLHPVLIVLRGEMFCSV